MICPYCNDDSVCPFYRLRYNPNNFYPPLTVTTSRITNSNEKINESLQIPVFSGNINKNILSNINSNIKNDIMEFRNQMESAAEENAANLKKQGKKPNPYQIATTYSITYNKNNILSVSLFYQEYIGGKNSYIRTAYNYDLNNGDSMSLGNLFKPSTNYLAVLNQKTRRFLQLNYPGMLPQFNGISEDQPYYIDNNTLVIFPRFNQIAPSISEIPLVRIPLGELSDILKPQLLRFYP
ncbi:DUF4163 domain-containing protein [Clostridium sp. 19966]|uniref:DUF4163 domain-containing protein n=1 Tax=Clostridium sp. 19966 TaxID=2768166 RepID=UPI0028E01544|nr:DUF4163 domain-containing protein [Clostridium sp. 19966]MDT8718174.1 DUF4163 domain-containing protein [Clostridium sp. 19966]